MNRKFWIRAATYIVAAVVGAAVVGTSVLWNEFVSPVSVESVREVSEAVYRHGMINLEVHAARTRPCPASTERWLWRQEGGLVHYIPLASVGYVMLSPGEQHVVVSYAIPRGTPPGPWFFHSMTIDRCPGFSGWFRPSMHETPDVLVDIQPDHPTP